MKRILSTILLTCATLPLLAKTTPTRSGDGQNFKTLFQCGEGTERGFEGWKLEGLSHKTITYFEHQQIEFFQHDAGNYSLGFIKRIDEMVGYNELRITAQIERLENCAINYATAYVSKDGQHWNALQKDVRLGADFTSDKMEYQFVKIVADVCFFQQGRFKMKSAQVFGRYDPCKDRNRMNLNAQGPASGETGHPIKSLVQEVEQFHLFAFEKAIHVETKNEKDYEIVVSNILGQIIHQSTSKGSNRFEVDVPNGIYFVIILQDDKRIVTQKVVF